MLKLTKLKSTEWLGNGMGTASAEWVVKGHEHIEIRQLGYDWMAFDTSKKFIAHILNGVPVERDTRIASAYTKRDLLEILSTKLSEV